MSLRFGAYPTKTLYADALPTNTLWSDRSGADTLQSMPARPIYEDSQAASVAFGDRLREVRRRVGMSQDGLAREADIHPTSIGRLERGGREPRLTTLLRLADGLGVEPGELVDRLGHGIAERNRRA